MRIQTLLRLAREEAGLTQQQLADRCKTGRSAISLAECGHEEPMPETLRRLVAGCGCRLVVEVRNPFYGTIRRDVPVPKLVRNAREGAHLTQTALAKLTGIGQSLISEYEYGKHEPMFGQLSHLLDSCGLTLTLRFERTE